MISLNMYKIILIQFSLIINTEFSEDAIMTTYISDLYVYLDLVLTLVTLETYD